jgi:hypothetical protein
MGLDKIHASKLGVPASSEDQASSLSRPVSIDPGWTLDIIRFSHALLRLKRWHWSPLSAKIRSEDKA